MQRLMRLMAVSYTHLALRGVDVQVALLELFRVDAVLGGVHAHPRNGQLSACLLYTSYTCYCGETSDKVPF